MYYQAIVVILGILSTLLISGKTKKSRFIGFWTNIIAQPFWVYIYYDSKQWAIIILAVFYTIISINGIKNNSKKTGENND